MFLHRVFFHLVLMVVTAALQGCYQDSPPSAPFHTVASLVMLLDDRDGAIRRTAAEALGKIGDPSAVPHLVSRLGDESPIVREAIARSLGRLGPLKADAGRRLVVLLLDPSPAVRLSTAQALGNAEVDQEVRSAIAAILSHEHSAAGSAALSALLGLDRVGDAQEELLRKAAGDDAHVRQLAVAVLGEQNDDRVVATLLDRLAHDADTAVRAEAAYRLGFHAEDTVGSGLTAAALGDSSAQVRRWARQSLAGPTTRDGVDSILQPAQSDPSGPAPRSR